MKRFAPMLVLLPVLLGCSEKTADQPDPRRELVRLDEHLTLGAPVTEGNLTVWPVFTDQPLDLGEFLTLQEAIEKRAAEVRELGGANQNANEPDNDQDFEGPQTNGAIGGGQSGASVSTLVIENKSDLPILICAGTVVKGGNQDRQIGQDFVVQAGTTVPVDAFCVEQGRWSGQRMGVATNARFEVVKTNATIGVRSKGQYSKDQGEVWQEVEKVKKRVLSKRGDNISVMLASSSYAVAVDENEKLAAADLGKVCAKVKDHFATFGEGDSAPVGFAYAVNGKPVNVRTFAHTRVFAKQFDVFVNTMATEAFLDRQEEFAPPTAEQIVMLVEEVRNADETLARTAALNSNGIRESAISYHNSCYVPSKDGKGRAVLTKDWTAR